MKESKSIKIIKLRMKKIKLYTKKEKIELEINDIDKQLFKLIVRSK